jgi:hypothetical protein
MTEVKALRAEVADVLARRQRGDLAERRFEREYAERSLTLCRAVVAARLARGERIELEHHVVHAHMKLSQSVLREPEQYAVSLFLTATRLFRLRSEMVPGRAVTCDEQDRTAIDEIALERVSGIRVERQVRWGEAAAGALICAVAILGRGWLAITAPLLLLLGVAGVVHALAMPTRWAVVETRLPRPGDEIRIHALGRKSGRALVRALRAQLVAAVGE